MPKKKTSEKPQDDLEKLSFEQAVEMLDQISDELETGKLELDDSLAKYEVGVGLLARCRSMLARAEQKVELLTSVDHSGAVHTEPFDDSATELDGTGRSRSDKRSAKLANPSGSSNPTGSKKDAAGDSRLF